MSPESSNDNFRPADATQGLAGAVDGALLQVVWFTAYTGVIGLVGAAAALGCAILIAASFGSSPGMDAYVVAISLIAVLPTAYQSAVADPAIAVLGRGDSDDRPFIDGLLTLTLLVGVAAALLASLAPAAWLSQAFPGLSERELALARALLTAMAGLPALMSCNMLFAAVLVARGRFVTTKLLVSVPSVVTLVTLGTLVRPLGLWALPAAAIASQACQAAASLVCLAALSELPRPTLRLQGAQLRAFARLALPYAIAFGLLSIIPAINRSFASAAEPGGAAILTYAEQLDAAVQGLALLPLITVMYPYLARAAARGEDEFFGLVIGLSKVCVLVCVPIGLFVALYAQPIVVLLLQRGDLGPDQARKVASSLSALAWGIPWAAVGLVFGRALLVQGRTWHAAAVAPLFPLLRWAFNAALAPMGVAGVAAGGSIQVALFVLVCAALVFGSRLGDLWHGGLVGCTLKASLASSVAAGVVALFPSGDGMLTGGPALLARLAIASGAYFAIYAVLAIALRAVQLGTLRAAAWSLLGRRGPADPPLKA